MLVSLFTKIPKVRFLCVDMLSTDIYHTFKGISHQYMKERSMDDGGAKLSKTHAFMVIIAFLLVDTVSSELTTFMKRRGFIYIKMLTFLQNLFVYPIYLLIFSLKKSLLSKDTKILPQFTEFKVLQKKNLGFWDSALLKTAAAYLQRLGLISFGTATSPYLTSLVIPMTLAIDKVYFGKTSDIYVYIGVLFSLSSYLVNFCGNTTIEFEGTLGLFLLLSIAKAIVVPVNNIMANKRSREIVNSNNVHAVIMNSLFSIFYFAVLLFFSQELTKKKVETLEEDLTPTFFEWLRDNPSLWPVLLLNIIASGILYQIASMMLIETLSLTSSAVVKGLIKPLANEAQSYIYMGQVPNQDDIMRFCLRFLAACFYTYGSIKKIKVQKPIKKEETLEEPYRSSNTDKIDYRKNTTIEEGVNKQIN